MSVLLFSFPLPLFFTCAHHHHRHRHHRRCERLFVASFFPSSFSESHCLHGRRGFSATWRGKVRRALKFAPSKVRVREPGKTSRASLTQFIYRHVAASPCKAAFAQTSVSSRGASAAPTCSAAIPARGYAEKSWSTRHNLDEIPRQFFLFGNLKSSYGIIMVYLSQERCGCRCRSHCQT